MRPGRLPRRRLLGRPRIQWKDYILAGLRMPWSTPDELDEVAREREVCVALLRLPFPATQPPISRRKWMDGERMLSKDKCYI